MPKSTSTGQRGKPTSSPATKGSSPNSTKTGFDPDQDVVRETQEMFETVRRRKADQAKPATQDCA